MDKSNISLIKLVYQNQLDLRPIEFPPILIDWLIFNIFSVFSSEDNTKFTADKKRKCVTSSKTAAAHPCPAFHNNRAMEGEESQVKLERVEKMRCYWELKHVQIKTLEQVTLQKKKS